MIKFEAGKTYSTRSIGDSNCIIRFKVTNRTAKTVQGYNPDATGRDAGKLQTFRINTRHDQVEYIRPWGRFSMAPTLCATDTAPLLADWAKSQNPTVIREHAAAAKALGVPVAVVRKAVNAGSGMVVGHGGGAYPTTPVLVLLQGGRA
jgi:hypothetical protein